MGLIILENMEFYAYHGCYKEEKIVGSKFLVDLTIEADLDTAGATDNLNDTVNYQIAYNIVKAEMGEKSNLIEHVALRILDSLFVNLEGILKATVKISKLNPPIGGKMEKISIILTR